jgi:hypothetical protein
MKGGEKMDFLKNCFDLLYKIIGAAVGAVTLYISVRKILLAGKGKRKRNASDDVPNN